MSTLTLTTWNVQNLFRPPAADKAALVVYRQKLRVLASVIRQLEPEVLALQEVGGDDALSDLQRAIGASLYEHRAIGTPDARGIACAVLSRLRFERRPAAISAYPPNVEALGVADLDGSPIRKMGRSALHVRVRRAGFPLDVIVVHLKSKLLAFPGGLFTTRDELLRARVGALALLKRAAEAATVRTAATQLLQQGRSVAVLGDLNDGPSAATTQLLHGPGGSTLTSRGFHEADDGDAQRLWNVSELIPSARRYSRVHHGAGELLDQILVSEALLARTKDGKRRVPVRVEARVEGLRSIGDDPRREVLEVMPDHAAVSAVFEV